MQTLVYMLSKLEAKRVFVFSFFSFKETNAYRKNNYSILQYNYNLQVVITHLHISLKVAQYLQTVFE